MVFSCGLCVLCGKTDRDGLGAKSLDFILPLGYIWSFKSMRIALKGLAEGINHLQMIASSEDLNLEGADFCGTSVIKVDLTITKNEPIYSIKGVVRGSARLVCARCLAEFETELCAPFERIVQRGKTFLDEGASDEITFIPPDADFGDVTDEVRDALLLALPIKPLCSEDCRGLCPLCGKNLNEGACTCRQERTDVRWNKLLALKSHPEA